MPIIPSAAFMIMFIAVLPGPLPADEQPNRAIIERALVRLADDIEVPAQAHGVLDKVEAREGDPVELNDPIAQIDDRDAQNKRLAAQIKLEAAQAEAANDIPEIYAEKSLEVAQAELEEALAAVRKVPNAIPGTTIRRLRLPAEEKELLIKKSALDRKIAEMNANIHSADVAAAEDDIERRQILAPVDGKVVEVLRDKGEWVQAGDVVMRIVRMDRLHVEGLLSSQDFDPYEVEGKPVGIRVQLARGRTKDFKGKVIFVSPLLQGARGQFLVRAVVENRKENDSWVLHPGKKAAMVIKLR